MSRRESIERILSVAIASVELSILPLIRGLAVLLRPAQSDSQSVLLLHPLFGPELKYVAVTEVRHHVAGLRCTVL
jgi:hypothetical protein